MKNESDLNKYLSKELKKFWPSLYHVKASDRFSAGISDFLIWFSGRTMALEVKFVREPPLNENSLLLSHPFSGPQLTFMESMVLSGNSAFGLVFIKSQDTGYLIPYKSIPETGNWVTKNFDYFGLRRSELPEAIKKTL